MKLILFIFFLRFVIFLFENRKAAVTKNINENETTVQHPAAVQLR